MFSYVHTTSKLIVNNSRKRFLDIFIKNYLFSLIGGLSQKEFGFDTLFKILNKISNFKNSLKDDQRLFIDSGGYSIIKGDVNPRDLQKFIECYNIFLKDYAETSCDKIFSLDIPIFLKYPSFNKKKNIYEINKKSLIASKKILDKNNKLYDKFIFVWQFKILNQYFIWNKLYNEIFKEEKKIKNFAIGGMVGLRKVSNIKFSPFILMFYKCLNLIINNGHKQNCIHMLGINFIPDRFTMVFLSLLSDNYYFHSESQNVEVLYDNIHYSIAGFFRIRNLKMIFNKNNKPILKHVCYDSDYIVSIFENKDKEIAKMLKDELNNLSEKKQFNDLEFFAILNVYKQLYVDYILLNLIKKYNIVKIFTESKNFNTFKHFYIKIYNMMLIDYPFIFKDYNEQILLNFKYIFGCHKWLMNDRSEQQFEKINQKFITHIKFPNILN